MAIQITSDNFEQYFLRTQEKYSDSLEQADGARGATVVTDLDSMKRTLVIPGVDYDRDPIENPNATAQEYVQIPYSILSDQLEDMQEATDDANTAASTANTAASNADTSRQQIEANESTRQSNEQTRQTQESGRVSAEQGRVSAEQGRVSAEQGRVSAESSRVSAESGRVSQASSDHTRAESDHSTAAADHTQAGQDHSQYTIDHQNVQGAENLNAQLSGYTVSITNRNGVTTSVDIGFEIYRTYTSVASMNADAANVPQGKFVVIATTDTTDPDNAKMYCKNSQGSFTFLCDLDQASSAAWAEWLNTQKPLIEGATASANAAATNANDKAALANTKAQLADTKAQYAESEGDRAKGYNDHPWSIGNDGYIYVWDETTEQMVRTNKMIINFDDLTEEQKEEMAQAFYDTLVFATVAEGQRAIAELT